VVRRPFCLTSLGGLELDPGFDAPRGSRFSQDSTSTSSFYQVHWYVDPVIFWLEAIFDNACLEQGGFDVAYLTELDPMWHDDELTFILNPEVALFGNLAARAACAADCAAATAGFPLNTLFWCAGCQGSLYPLNGNVQAHIGGVQASSLEMTRLIAKMHREGLMWAASGEDGLCGYYPQPIMDKTGYKYHMLYPIPQTAQIRGNAASRWGDRRSCGAPGASFPSRARTLRTWSSANATVARARSEAMSRRSWILLLALCLGVGAWGGAGDVRARPGGSTD
jgi:conjugal transfer pilus assembly protein TraU